MADSDYSTENLVVLQLQARSREVWVKATATITRLLDEERPGRGTTLYRSGDTARYVHEFVTVDSALHAANSNSSINRTLWARFHECVERCGKWTELFRCAMGKVLQHTPAVMVSIRVTD